MRKLIIVLFAACFIGVAHSQEDTSRYFKYPATYGVSYPRMWPTKVLRTPFSDTSALNAQPGAIQAGLDGKPYWWNGIKWEAFSGGVTWQQSIIAGNRFTQGNYIAGGNNYFWMDSISAAIFTAYANDSTSASIQNQGNSIDNYVFSSLPSRNRYFVAHQIISRTGAGSYAFVSQDGINVIYNIVGADTTQASISSLGTNGVSIVNATPDSLVLKNSNNYVAISAAPASVADSLPAFDVTNKDKLTKIPYPTVKNVGNADSVGHKPASYYAGVKYVDSLQDLTLSRFVNYPDSFTFRPFSMAIDRNGNAVAVGFDVKGEWRHLLDNTGFTKYYVDPRNGNDANNGLSWNAPKKSYWNLYNSSGNKVINIKPLKNRDAVYYIDETNLTSAIKKSRIDTTIVVSEGYAPLTNFYKTSQFAWTDTANMSKATSSKFGASGRDSVGDVVDFAKKDSLGDWVMYKKVHNIQSCADTAGTYYCDTANIGAFYVHTLDGRRPDSLLRIGNASQYNVYVNADSGYIVYENITFYGGTVHTYLTFGKVNNLDVRFLNCTAAYTGTQVGFPNAISLSNIKDWGYGFTVRGIKSVYNFYPVGHTVEADAGHYEDTVVGGQRMNVIEFGANFYNCGNVIKTFNVGGDASNGSSSHGGANILRINCKYAYNRGQNVSDIGYNRSLLIACSAFNSTSSGLSATNPGDRRKADYGVNDGQMYLINCEAHNSLYSVQTKSLVPIFADGQAIISNSILKGLIQ